MLLPVPCTPNCLTIEDIYQYPCRNTSSQAILFHHSIPISRPAIIVTSFTAVSTALIVSPQLVTGSPHDAKMKMGRFESSTTSSIEKGGSRMPQVLLEIQSKDGQNPTVAITNYTRGSIGIYFFPTLCANCPVEQRPRRQHPPKIGVLSIPLPHKGSTTSHSAYGATCRVDDNSLTSHCLSCRNLQ